MNGTPSDSFDFTTEYDQKQRRDWARRIEAALARFEESSKAKRRKRKDKQHEANDE